MLKLCGFHISNYHNKVRIALLEKGVPFEEDPSCRPCQEDEFLEETYPQKSLYPADPLARAKVRELIVLIELHVELVARRLYGQVFFGKPAAEDVKQAVEKDLAKGIRALRARAKFDPYIAGAELSLADCTAFVSLPLVSLATKHAYGRDFLEDIAQLKPYLKMLEERPAFRQVNADRKAATARAKK